MNSKLTLNLEKIDEQNMSYLLPTDVLKLLETKIILNEKEQQKAMYTSWNTTSSELRNFIEETFGICFSIEETDHYSHNRNQLNKIIKKVKNSNTQQGKKTKLNFYEYSELIKSDDFIKFITVNLQKDFEPNDQEKMYEELMYLQVNKFQESDLYLKKMNRNYGVISSVLASMNSDLPAMIKRYYLLYLSLEYGNLSYNDFDFSDNVKILLEIVKYRFIQDDITVYKFDSYDDVESTNHEQIIKWFVQDIIRWDNTLTDGSLK